MKKVFIMVIVMAAVLLTACSEKKPADPTSNDGKQENVLESQEILATDSEKAADESEQSRVIKIHSETDQLYSAEIDVMGQQASDVIIGAMESFS